MGTRSLTYVFSEYSTKKPIICMYRQYDGYPSGHGVELGDFLAPITLVEGINNETPEHAANGMGCLAAQLVAHFKTEIGGIYLEPPLLSLDAGQEYEYHIHPNVVYVFAKLYSKRKKILYSCAWQNLSELSKTFED